MWRRILHFFRKPTQSDNLLAEFEDTLMLIVDPEQLTNNLLSKLDKCGKSLCISCKSE